VLRGRGRGHEGGGEGALGQKIRGGANPNSARVGWAVGRCGAVAVDSGEAGSVVANDGALALHHGERERYVWGSRMMGEGHGSEGGGAANF
jgi:hypothetical protein